MSVAVAALIEKNVSRLEAWVVVGVVYVGLLTANLGSLVHLRVRHPEFRRRRRVKTFAGLFFFSSRRRHTRFDCDWSSDVCSSDLETGQPVMNAIVWQDRRTA